MTDQQYSILLGVLSRFSDRIERIDIYGSRARGTHRPGSDIDLIIAGDLTLEDLLRISVALDESDLLLDVDLSRYGDNPTPDFARQVQRDARILFTAGDLIAARRKGVAQPRERHWNTY